MKTEDKYKRKSFWKKKKKKEGNEEPSKGSGKKPQPKLHIPSKKK